MAGHSKWHNIKHKKAAQDQKRGKIFTKIMREIYVAVKQGGPNPDNNPRLRLAMEMAKEVNMPKDNVERAIKKATGGAEGENMDEVLFEGYGPGGIAMYISAITDNRNRTSSQIRSIFSKYGGTLAEAGSVSWMFEMKGVLTFSKRVLGDKKDLLTDTAIESGADDINEDKDNIYVMCDPKNFEALKEKLNNAGFSWESAEVTYIPKNTVKVSGKVAESILKLMEVLDEHDDVNKVWANFEIEDEELEKFMATA
ncbi:MAG: YebC/PmpR family DNA-binding transcriptional regulator [Candidatus Calescibacterium sp.]|nr:YebC/PmpR family DNA-binding transcriptional regulator [Candidatus Calescibacterium sp.]MCX7734301.1 YebC/PmpR family DNA-binding transcriptional regulator [bacterium]MDW8087133.1 YebC/PmpR family DNA-binding transcriptional regulator [Candidatus Calescibacterium sp.]